MQVNQKADAKGKTAQPRALRTTSGKASAPMVITRITPRSPFGFTNERNNPEKRS